MNHEVCACGRTLVRMGKPRGRTDDMLIIRGINVFPSQVESVLLELGMAPSYQIVVDRISNLDTMEVQVEMTPDMFGDTVRSLEGVEHKIANALQSTLNIAAKVRLLEPKSIPRTEGKSQACDRQSDQIIKGGIGMQIQQISIFVENKSGRLAGDHRGACRSEGGYSRRSIAVTSDFGILRLIVDKPKRGSGGSKGSRSDGFPHQCHCDGNRRPARRVCQGAARIGGQ